MVGRRSWGLVGLLAVACSFGSSQAGAAGDEGSGTSTDPTAPTSSDDPTSTSQGSATGSGTSQGTTSLGPTSEASTANDKTTDPDTSSESTSGDTSETGEPGTLVDDGLIGRYFLDEAPEGTDPPSALDSSGNELHMPITYNADVVRYVTVGGNRGLEWTMRGAVGGPSISAGGPITDAYNGAQQATLEVVVDAQDVVNTGSRFMHIGVDENSDLSMVSGSLDRVELRTFGAVGVARWPHDLPGSGRVVLTIVVDTTQAEGSDRSRLYVDGIQVAPMGPVNISQNQTMSIEGGARFFLGNRGESNDRSFQGILYYAALYSVALSEADVQTNAARLGRSDDS